MRRLPPRTANTHSVSIYSAPLHKDGCFLEPKTAYTCKVSAQPEVLMAQANNEWNMAPVPRPSYPPAESCQLGSLGSDERFPHKTETCPIYKLWPHCTSDLWRLGRGAQPSHQEHIRAHRHDSHTPSAFTDCSTWIMDLGLKGKMSKEGREGGRELNGLTNGLSYKRQPPPPTPI